MSREGGERSVADSTGRGRGSAASVAGLKVQPARAARQSVKVAVRKHLVDVVRGGRADDGPALGEVVTAEQHPVRARPLGRAGRVWEELGNLPPPPPCTSAPPFLSAIINIIVVSVVSPRVRGTLP